MKKLFIFLTIIACMAMLSPKEKHKGHNTDYHWYNNKYQNYWELSDSLIYCTDTLYIYKMGGQCYVFNQNCKRTRNAGHLNR